jgi:hypothetical protein
MSDKPTITVWCLILSKKTFEWEGNAIAPIIYPIRYTAQHIAQRLNFPHETDALYFESKEHAEEYLANYLAAQEKKVFFLCSESPTTTTSYIRSEYGFSTRKEAEAHWAEELASAVYRMPFILEVPIKEASE